MSTLRDSLTVDPAITQNAAFRFDALALAAIDDKIRACEEHLINSSILGLVAPNYLIKAGSAYTGMFGKGVAVCCSGATTGLEVDLAVTANLTAQANRIIGILAQPGTPGTYARVIVNGIVPANITGLGPGAIGNVYVSASDGTLTRSVTSYQVGTCDAYGNVLLNR